MTEPVVRAPGEGDALWWLGSLSTIKLSGAATGGSIDVVDHLVPAGYAPPPHVHTDQDEVFSIVEGEFTVHCGDQTWTAGPGTLVFLPRGVAHGFSVSDAGPGRTLLINTPAGFADVVRELGVPATELRLPGPEVPTPSPERIGEVSQRYGIGPG